MKRKDYLLGLIIFAISMTLISSCISIVFYFMSNKAIEHGCGQYNSITGDFEWIRKIK